MCYAAFLLQQRTLLTIHPPPPPPLTTLLFQMGGRVGRLFSSPVIQILINITKSMKIMLIISVQASLSRNVSVSYPPPPPPQRTTKDRKFSIPNQGVNFSEESFPMNRVPIPMNVLRFRPLEVRHSGSVKIPLSGNLLMSRDFLKILKSFSLSADDCQNEMKSHLLF